MKILHATQFEVEDLRLVAAICELGTLSRAAMVLHRSQSALSHRLSNLEFRLGSRLFERLGRCMKPTAAGYELDRSAAEILRAMSQVENSLRSKEKTEKMSLRIATQCYTCYSWLPRVLKRYKQQCAACDVCIVLDATPSPIHALIEGRIDLAIIDQFNPKDRRVRTYPIFSDELLAVTSESHPWAKRQVITPRDFATERLIAHSCSPRHNILLNRILRPARIIPSETYEVPLTEAILELVKAGFGVAALSRWAISPHLKAGFLVGLPIGKGGFSRSWSVAMLGPTSRLGHVRQLIELLTSEFRSEKS